MKHCGTKNNILILVSSLEGGGAERIAATIAASLTEKEYPVLLAVIKRNTSAKYSSDTAIHYLSKNHRYRNFAYLIFPVICFRYVHLVRTYRPDVTLSILPVDNVLNLLVSHFFQIPAIMSAHGMHSKSGRGLIHYFILLEEYLLKHTKAKAIAVSNGVKQSMITHFSAPPEKIHVLYNPLDVARIHSLSRENVSDNFVCTDIPTIITVGRLHHVKAQWHLIRAFAAFRRARPAQLLICGVGDEEAYLKTLAKDLGIADDVIFLGWQDNPYKYMARADVFVLPSLSESFGNVLVEAMASGCPVISADCSPGVHEIIGEHNEYGLLAEKMSGVRHAVCEPLDAGEQSLLVLMKRLLDDNELHDELVRKGRERAEFFSLERRMKEYEEFLEAQIS